MSCDPASASGGVSRASSRNVVDCSCVADKPEERAVRMRNHVEAGARHVVFDIFELEEADQAAEVALAAAC